MGYTKVWAEIDLDDVDTRDLINELETRGLSNREEGYLLNLIRDNAEDAAKMRLFLQVQHRYSLKELSELFKEDCSTPIPKNQLSLSL